MTPDASFDAQEPSPKRLPGNHDNVGDPRTVIAMKPQKRQQQSEIRDKISVGNFGSSVQSLVA